jgi:hypothetical protein
MLKVSAKTDAFLLRQRILKKSTYSEKIEDPLSQEESIYFG